MIVIHQGRVALEFITSTGRSYCDYIHFFVSTAKKAMFRKQISSQGLWLHTNDHKLTHKLVGEHGSLK